MSEITNELHEILDDENRKLTADELKEVVYQLKQDCWYEYYKENTKEKQFVIAYDTVTECVRFLVYNSGADIWTGNIISHWMPPTRTARNERRNRMKITQCEMIEDYINNEYGSISALEALRDLGIMRLASRIAEMKNSGLKIKSEMVSVATRNGGRTHIARYSWADDNVKFNRKECEGV